MRTLRSLVSAAGAGAAAVIGAGRAALHCERGRLRVSPARPVYVAARAPNVYVGPCACGHRWAQLRDGAASARVWVGDHYAYRTVRRCF